MVNYHHLSVDGLVLLRKNAENDSDPRTGRHDPAKVKYNKEVPKMAAGARVKITLRCNECKQRNYNTKKNKKNTPDRIEMMKYCRFCRKHTMHSETK